MSNLPTMQQPSQGPNSLPASINPLSPVASLRQGIGITPDVSQSPTISHRSKTDEAETESPNGQRIKPKQKRNKPTLSCEECVERKTKCDRGRPTCLACIKRQSECHYTQVANLIASVVDQQSDASSKARFVTGPPHKIRKISHGVSSTVESANQVSPEAPKSSAQLCMTRPRPASHDSPFLLSHIPFSKSKPSNIFGIGSTYPFSNYWTASGGLPEVISVLPSKEQADMLIAKYFECFDPVYPFIHRRTFTANYESFWASPSEEKNKADADLLGLHYAVYALGTQFMQFSSYTEKTSSAEFYASAATQSLRSYSYLNRTSLRAVAAMLLLTYFLMNDNHASDAYSWAGLMLRQAYAMRLHRDPDTVVPDAPEVEKHARRKLWQAVFFQDTFLTVLLKLPPSATHSDVDPDSLVDESVLEARGIDIYVGVNSRVENLMSISVIAPQTQTVAEPPLLPNYKTDPASDKADVEYIRSTWKLGNMVQEHLCSPMALSLPLFSSPRQKTSLISSFRTFYRNLPVALSTLEILTLQQWRTTKPRSLLQNLFFTSNFFHCMMLLQLGENEGAGVEANIRGTLEAAHEAVWAFVKLNRFFASETSVFWVFQHRAFEEALTIANILSMPPSTDANYNDAMYTKCKEDVSYVIALLENNFNGSAELQKTRLDALQAASARILV